ncbi:MAG: DNA mismatch repair protein MutS, partial [Alistipes sp.]|nr:DNA mismatch repair protein MutS [Alistipes sp.]
MAIEKKYVETPLMKQYYQIKAVHPDAILLFRVGDFYETFGDDAIQASSILGITLTKRANGSASSVELAGFPHHAVETYLPKLVRAGKRVAICEQLEDPKTVKGLVKRGVIELVTPAVTLSENLVENKENIYLASVSFGKSSTGVAFLDITTGEFFVAEGDDRYVEKLISSFAPKEIVYQRGCEDRFRSVFGTKHYTYRLEQWVFSHQVNVEKLCTQFGVQSLRGFGVEELAEGVTAAGAILYYLEFTEHKQIAHISSIARLDQNDYVWVDKFTIRNLELFHSNGGGDTSFAKVIDRTSTPMGGRLLRRWIAMPILDIERITRRQNVVSAFVADRELAGYVKEQISSIGDLERIVSRVASMRVTPRELVQLKSSLSAVELLKAA